MEEPRHAPRLREALLPEIHPHPFSNVTVDLHQAVHGSIPHLRVKTHNTTEISTNKAAEKPFFRIKMKATFAWLRVKTGKRNIQYERVFG